MLFKTLKEIVTLTGKGPIGKARSVTVMLRAMCSLDEEEYQKLIKD
jgi:hypothetical protein